MTKATGFGKALPKSFRKVKSGYDQEFTLQKGVSAAPIKQSTVLQEILGGGILGIGASIFIPEVHGGKGPIPADPPETFPAEDTWDKSFKDEGLTIPTEEKIKVPDSIPPQIKKEPEGFPIPEQKGWQDYVLYKKKVEEDLHAQAHKNRKKIVVSGRDRTAEYAENYKGFYKKQNLPKLKDTLSISEKTTEIKFKPDIVEERIKNL